MKKNFKLGVIGAGLMSSAIINGVISSKVLKSNEIIVSDINDASLEKMQSKGLYTTKDNNEVLTSAEFVLFAVKPQSLASVFETIKSKDNKKIITIMAGVKKEKFHNFFSDSIVVRCMPNTPCAIGSGAIGMDLSELNCDEDKNFVKSIFSSLASISFVDESKLNAVTGISGSSPAYFFYFIKNLVEAGVKNGLTYEDSLKLSVNTMIGSGKMILNSDKTLDELIQAVCSKGGTTLEAMKVFTENGLDKITSDAVDACIKRAFELESL